jgi:16S rRNA G966 N2-methylase RsmD
VLDSNSKVSITKMLETLQILQSGMTMKSEHVVQMDPKFALNRVHESAKKIQNNEMEMNHEATSIIERTQKEKFMASEASH